MCSASISGKGQNVPFWKGLLIALLERQIFCLSRKAEKQPFWKGKKYAFSKRQSASLFKKAISKPFQKGVFAPFPEMLAGHISRNHTLRHFHYEFITKSLNFGFSKSQRLFKKLFENPSNLITEYVKSVESVELRNWMQR